MTQGTSSIHYDVREAIQLLLYCLLVNECLFLVKYREGMRVRFVMIFFGDCLDIRIFSFILLICRSVDFAAIFI